MHFPWSSLFNLVVLVGILAYYLRGPLKAFVRSRHDYLRDEVARVEAQLKLARERHDEFSAKLKAIDAEVQAIHDQIRQDAEAMKVRVTTEARRLAQTIVADSRSSAESLYSDLRKQLRIELAERVVVRAESILRDRLTGDDRARIRNEFSQQLGGNR